MNSQTNADVYFGCQSQRKARLRDELSGFSQVSLIWTIFCSLSKAVAYAFPAASSWIWEALSCFATLRPAVGCKVSCRISPKQKTEAVVTIFLFLASAAYIITFVLWLVCAIALFLYLEHEKPKGKTVGVIFTHLTVHLRNAGFKNDLLGCLGTWRKALARLHDRMTWFLQEYYHAGEVCVLQERYPDYTTHRNFIGPVVVSRERNV